MSRSIRTKIIATFIVVMIAVVIVAIVAGFQYVHQYERTLSDTMGVSAAESCATVLEVMADDGVELNLGNEEYENYRKVLRTLCADSGMEYMYAYRCDPENETITYIICVAADDEEDARVARERAYGTVVSAEIPEQELRALRGERAYEALVIDNQFGTMLAWFDKVEGWGGNVIAGADYSLSKQRARIIQTTVAITVPLVLLLLVLLLIQMFLLNKYVFTPIHAVSERMKAFSAKHTVDFEPLGINSRDEIGEIAHAFEGMASDIGEYAKDIERMTTERVQVDVELDVARRIQQGMVPEHKEVLGSGYDTFAISHPARTVGGDFYDAYELDSGRIALVVGDVSGKGLGAALYMTLAQTIIRDGLLVGLGPAEVLNIVNERLCVSNPEGMFVTVFVCVLDVQSGTVQAANAGHMPPIIIDCEAREAAVDTGILLGLFDDADIKEETIELKPDECLLLYTDGVTEAVNDKEEFFGTDALLRCLDEGKPFATAQAVVETVTESVESFANGSEQFDDLTVLVIHRGASSRTELPVDMDAFDVLRDEILSKAQDRTFGLRACLACEEAFVNIVSYSGAQSIWASVEHEDQGLRVILEDDGVYFDPFANDVRKKEFEELDEGGMGIGIIRDETRKASYRREANHNVLELLF